MQMISKEIRRNSTLRSQKCAPRSSRRSGGFTLVELLVVIAIIGILASIILVSLNSAKVQARDAKRISDLKEIQLALELYYDSNNYYPIKLSANNLVSNGYISVIPTDPTSAGTCVAGNETSCYYYSPLCTTSNPLNPSGYHLGATLENNTNSALNSEAGVTPNTEPSGLSQSNCGNGALQDFSGSLTNPCPNTNTGNSGQDCYDVHS